MKLFKKKSPDIAQFTALGILVRHVDNGYILSYGDKVKQVKSLDLDLQQLKDDFKIKE